MAEGRGKAQADTLRKARAETQAHRLRSDGHTECVPSSKLRSGDIVVVTAGDFIPGDGEVIEGVASVDESAITGESAPVIRESGGDRSAVTGGTRVLSDEIKVCITSNPGETFLDRMIKLVEGASRQKTPNEIALNILLAGLTIIFLLAVVTLQPFAIYSGAPQNIFVLASLLVCLIPTTIGGLLSAIGIAGMDRLIQRNVIAMSGRAVEASGDVDVLLLDKTGTITLGNRAATQFFPAPGVEEAYLADAAQLSSLADETPEGRSIVVLAKERYHLRGRDLSTRAFVLLIQWQPRNRIDLRLHLSCQHPLLRGSSHGSDVPSLFRARIPLPRGGRLCMAGDHGGCRHSRQGIDRYHSDLLRTLRAQAGFVVAAKRDPSRDSIGRAARRANDRTRRRVSLW